MNGWEPGTVAKATVRGMGDVTAFRMAGSQSWALAAQVAGTPGSLRGIAVDDEVTDVRPLVVLDLPGVMASQMVDHLRRAARVASTSASHPLYSLANRIEAQTQRRLEEPTGRYAAVVDASGSEWVRGRNGEWVQWLDPHQMPTVRRWADVGAVRVLSDGVTP